MVTEVDSGCDVMQVCRNGHVITDRLRSDPASGRTHCDRCGAATLDRCATCGEELPCAAAVAGLVPLGTWPAPPCCPTCGATFPWGRKPRPGPDALVQLEELLRRVPLVIRQLRWRQDQRTPFTVADEHDLEDLLRAVLALCFDDVRLESRTPLYSPGTRTDLLLAAEKIAITAKFARPAMLEQQIAREAGQDVAYYRQRGGCRTLVFFVHDPEGVIRDEQLLRNIGTGEGEDLEAHWVVGRP